MRGQAHFKHDVFDVVFSECAPCADLIEELLALARLHDELKVLGRKEDIVELHNVPKEEEMSETLRVKGRRESLGSACD